LKIFFFFFSFYIIFFILVFVCFLCACAIFFIIFSLICGEVTFGYTESSFIIMPFFGVIVLGCNNTSDSILFSTCTWHGLMMTYLMYVEILILYICKQSVKTWPRVIFVHSTWIFVHMSIKVLLRWFYNNIWMNGHGSGLFLKLKIVPIYSHEIFMVHTLSRMK
jgi:hypothetical protein